MVTSGWAESEQIGMDVDNVGVTDGKGGREGQVAKVGALLLSKLTAIGSGCNSTSDSDSCRVDDHWWNLWSQ